MSDKTVLHKRNGHRPLPGPEPQTLAQIIGLVHSDRAPGAGLTADLLRFAAVMRSERLPRSAAPQPDGGGLMGPSLLRALDRTREMLDRGPWPGLRQGLASLAAQAEAAARMVEQITRHTAEAGPDASGPGRHEVVDLNALLTRTLGLLGARPGPQAEVAARLDPGLPRVAGDPIELQQALLTLVSIAQLAAGPDGGSVRVATSAAPGALRGERVVAVHIEVPDAGQDMSDPGEPAPADGDHDTWMGPAVRLVARIVAEHGGALSMLPRRDARAGFRMELPGA